MSNNRASMRMELGAVGRRLVGRSGSNGSSGNELTIELSELENASSLLDEDDSDDYDSDDSNKGENGTTNTSRYGSMSGDDDELDKVAGMIRNTKELEYNRILNDSNLPPLEGVSCWKYKPSNRYRIAVHKFVNHSWSKNFILFCIMANVIVLAIDSPAAKGSVTPTLRTAFNIFDLVVSIIFTIEMILYMFALSTTVYLRDPWYRLDFVVVISSWVGQLPFLSFNLQAFRALRALRPLKALKFFDGIRAILDSLNESLKLLVDVLLFMIFFFAFFGITAIQLFQGSLARRCAMKDTGEVAFPETFCAPRSANKGHTCPSNQFCKDTQEYPNYGFNSFDDIVLSFNTIFQCISLEGWTSIMYSTMDAEYEIAWIWFVLIVVLISFLVINLFVAVISATFSRVREQENRSAFVRAKNAAAKSTMIVERNGKYYLEKKEEEQTSPNPVVQFFSDLGSYFPDLPQSVVSTFARFVTQEYSNKDVDSKSTAERFDLFINLCIIVNTIFLAMEHHNMSADFVLALQIAEYVFNGIFLLEMVIKILGMNGFMKYISRSDNRFDFVIVVTTIPAMVINDVQNSFTVLRTFRLLRVVRLMKRYPRVQKLLKTVLGSLIAITNLLAFMTFSLLVFAILGMQLFGGTYNFDPKPRENFDRFDDAVITLFIVLTGENWIDPYYNAMRSSAGWAAPFFFITFYLFANYILLNLFIAVILENFELKENEKHELQRRAFWEKRGVGLQRHSTATDRLIGLYNRYVGSQSNEVVKINGISRELTAELPRRFVDRYLMTEPLMNKEREVYDESLQEAERKGASLGPANDTASSLAFNINNPRTRLRQRKSVVVDLLSANNQTGPREVTYLRTNARQLKEMAFNEESAAHEIANESGENDLDGMILDDQDDSDVDEDKEFLSMFKAFTKKREAAHEEKRREHQNMLLNSQIWKENEAYNKSLFCLTPQNPIRSICIRIVDIKWFDHLILVSILVSSVFLAMENPETRRDPTFSQISSTADLIFLIIFSVELVIKVVAKGIWLTPESYLSDSWNRLDAAVLVFSYLAFFASEGTGVSAGSVGRAFRIGRALRPLRFINRNEGMKDIINSIIESRQDIFNVVMLWVAFLTIFAILGINLFAGLYYHCTDLSVDGRAECVGSFVNELGILVPRVWTNPPYSFDDFPASMLTLFEVSSLEGWISVMYGAMDMVGLDKNPRENYSKLNSLYFIIFIFIGSFFVVKLFVGVIIDNFTKINGSSRMTNAQKRWLDMRKVMVQVRPTKRPPRPKNGFRAALFDFIAHPSFDKVIMIAILINVLLMATEYNGQPRTWTDFLTQANWFFLGVFTVEMVIKIMALNLKNYLKNGWNVFDAAVVVGSLIFELAEFSLRRNAFVRAFRILRIVRIIRSAKGLRTLFNTLLTSLPSMLNVGALLILCIFVYAVIGVQLFGEVKYGHFTKRLVNFNHIGLAFLTLFRVLTGEDWNGIMHDLQVERPYCSDTASWVDCGQPVVAPIYFVTFYILGAYVFLNLLIAVILENFSYCYNKEVSMIGEQDLARFKQVWLMFDPKAKGYIRLYSLLPFLRHIGPPMGLQVRNTREKFRYLRLYYECRHKLLRRMRQHGIYKTTIPRRYDRIKFRTLLLILARSIVGLESLEFERALRRQHQLQKLDREIAATLINAAARGFLLRRRLQLLLGSSTAYQRVAMRYLGKSGKDGRAVMGRRRSDEPTTNTAAELMGGNNASGGSSHDDAPSPATTPGVGYNDHRVRVSGSTPTPTPPKRWSLSSSNGGAFSPGMGVGGADGWSSMDTMSQASLDTVSAGVQAKSVRSFVGRLAKHNPQSQADADNSVDADRNRFIEDMQLDDFLQPMDKRFVPMSLTGGVKNGTHVALGMTALSAPRGTRGSVDDYGSEGDATPPSSPPGSPRPGASSGGGDSGTESGENQPGAASSRWKRVRVQARKGELKRNAPPTRARPRRRRRADSLYDNTATVMYDLDVVGGQSEKKRQFMASLEQWESQFDSIPEDELRVPDSPMSSVDDSDNDSDDDQASLLRRQQARRRQQQQAKRGF